MKIALFKRAAAGTVAAAIMLSIVPFTDFKAAAAAYPEGFVYADGTKFMCDGSPYYYGGTNCYYLTYKSKSEVKNVFDDSEDMGLKVIRIWGNLDVGRKTGETDPKSGYPIFEGNNDGIGEKDGVYFQYWDDEAGRPLVNEGADGLRRLDYIISQAEQHNMKLIITFTNYWEAFGGMGQYVKWYQMSQGKSVSNGKIDENDCCEFYTNETMKGWYKDYISTLLNHKNYYTGEKLMDSEAVFSWELSNEPRCKADEFCKDDTLYSWAVEMSRYVKSIDPYHMVSIGDEGFYNLGYQEAGKQKLPSAAYSGYYGVDFEKLMTIDTVDFGTPHMYVDQWGFDLKEDDLEWIKRHAETTEEAEKPVIFEEFGLTDKSKRDAAYSDWLDIITGDYYDGIEYQGFNYWMIASYLDDGNLYQDYDGYTVYGPEGQATESSRKLIMNAADVMNKKNIVNTSDKNAYDFDRSSPADIDIKLTLKLGSICGFEFDGKALTEGKEYTVNGNTVTLKASFLKEQELSKYNARVRTTEGNSPKITVSIRDSLLPKPEIAPSAVSVDINPRECKDAVINMDLKTSVFRGLSCAGSRLAEGVDYTVSGNEVRIKASFLKTLSVGANEVIFDFYEGEDGVLTINVTDTTGLDEFDSFEGYGSDSELWKAYSANTSGNTTGLSLADKNGGKALAFTYDVGSPNGYCGVNHPIAARDMSAFFGVELWIEGDGSGSSFTVQLRDGNDKYFEKELTLDFTGGKTIRIPFSEFKAPQWQQGGSLDVTKINQFSFYGGSGGNTASGTIFIDNVFAYKVNGEKPSDPYLVNKTGIFDGNSPAGVRTDLVLNGEAVASIVCESEKLTAGVDYSTNGSQIMLGESFLKTLASGEYRFTYNFTNGTYAIFELTVVNGASQHKHSYISSITKEASCTERGEITYSCTCGDKYTEEIPAKGHSWAKKNTVAPTEKEQGYTVYECTVCGEKKNDDFTDPIEHKHSYISSIMKEASCTEKGEITYSCTCGDKYTEEIPAKGHSESGWIIDKEASETENGLKHTECLCCGEIIKSDIIPALGTEEPDEKKAEIYSGMSYGTGWSQAVSLLTNKNGGGFDASVIKENGYFLLEYDGEPYKVEIILQSWSGAGSWSRVSAYEYGEYNGHSCLKFSYSDCVKAFGSDNFMAMLDQLHIGAMDSGITIYSLSYCNKDDGGSGKEDKPDAYISAFWGAGSCGAWGQAVSVSTTRNGGSFDPSCITEGGYFYIEYSGAKDEIELILQSWSGAEGWAKVQAFETGSANGNFYAKYSYGDCIKAFGTADFTKLDRIHAGSKNGSITVYLVCYCYPAE